MSQRFDSTDYAARGPGLAGVPARTAITIAGWILLPSSAPGSVGMIFEYGSNGLAASHGLLRWNTGGVFRVGHSNEGANFGSNPAFNQWVYFFLQTSATVVRAGWKTIAGSSFTTQATSTEYGSGTLGEIRIGTGTSNTLAMDVFRVSVWGEEVSEANLLLAAATDLGYTTNINTHLPLTNGIGSPWNDTSGNARNWTTSGTFSDQADPSLGSSTKPWAYLAQL